MLPVVFAAVLDQGVCNGGGGPECPTPLNALNSVFGNLIATALPVGGVILFVMLMIGGIYFILSGPDPKRLQAAQNTLTFAILGAIILALAFLIINLIAGFTGADIGTFNIYQG